MLFSLGHGINILRVHDKNHNLDRGTPSAAANFACDDMFCCWINGKLVMELAGWSRAYTLDVAKYLTPGKNVIRILAADEGAPPCGLLYALSFDDGREILSGSDTRVSKNGRDGWDQVEVLGKYGIKPWLEQVSAVPYAPPEEEVPLPKE